MTDSDQYTSYLLGKNFPLLLEIVTSNGGNVRHAQRLSTSVYRKRIKFLEEIQSFPKDLISKITDRYTIGSYGAVEQMYDSDGSVKSLFQNGKNQLFESVLMHGLNRNTLCISTQAGCRMGCRFCLTGSVGFNGNLEVRDIVNQLVNVPANQNVNRLVLMGMGEPFDNFDAVSSAVEIFCANWGFAFGKSNITLSTVGVLGGLRKFLESPFCNLAISLHSPFRDERKYLMPVEQSNPIEEVINLIKKYPLPKPLRVSFEYVALGGVNLSEKHATAISELLKGIQCHLNIIPWNSHENAQFNTPSNDDLQMFINCLNSLGVLTAIRKSMANEIGAACGQMAGKYSGIKRI